MSSTKGYLEFILEQLSELDGITHRAMMGRSFGKVSLKDWMSISKPGRKADRQILFNKASGIRSAHSLWVI